MERKTMGAFIAALRKASGMTQKELAEKLNVSDKSVSRWERDDGAPDLSLIPVIAEVFGVTCDELLRGERRAEAAAAAPSPKGEKACRRILAQNLARYRSRSLIAMGIAVLGLIAAMVGNLGFLRAYIGFFAGMVFFLAAAICQAIFINGALLSVEDDSLDGEGSAEFRGKVIRVAKASFGVIVTLFAATLPLVVFVDDTYWGLNGGDWLGLGLIFGAVGLGVWSIVCYFGRSILAKKGIVPVDASYRHNRKLLLRCMAGLLAIALVTLMVQALVNNRFSAWDIAGGEEFADYDSFKAYMEQPVEYDGFDNGFVDMEPSDEAVYYDEFGNAISEEEFWRTDVVIYDGSEEGRVVCTFLWRNRNVSFYRNADTKDGLPITAVTYADSRAANRIVDAYNIAFAALYGLEVLGILIVYRRKRIK